MAFVLVIGTFEFRICLGSRRALRTPRPSRFRTSDFEFDVQADMQKI
jgi:hypothetical protein